MTLDFSKTGEVPKSDRRGPSRTQSPTIEILCEGDMYIVDNWGFGGCQFHNYTGCFRPGNRALLEMYLLGFHECESLSILAKVLRYEPENDNAVVFQFLELSAQTILDFCDSVEKSLGDQVREANA